MKLELCEPQLSDSDRGHHIARTELQVAAELDRLASMHLWLSFDRFGHWDGHSRSTDYSVMKMGVINTPTKKMEMIIIHHNPIMVYHIYIYTFIYNMAYIEDYDPIFESSNQRLERCGTAVALREIASCFKAGWKQGALCVSGAKGKVTCYKKWRFECTHVIDYIYTTIYIHNYNIYIHNYIYTLLNIYEYYIYK